MAGNLEIKSVLDLAIGREEEAFRFYSEVSGRVENPGVKEIFDQLAKDELGHKVFLQACLKDPELASKLPVPTDYKIAEATAEPSLSIDMKPADALAVAMKKELGAAEFYQDLARSASDATLTAMFENLARMELGHKSRIEHMFVDIGYPEVF
ncbi:MAG TPA: ferritin family protein [Thermoanaerobaculales bacterium]|nr:ferritin family protein [Thermoanaerobaculales bacterium]HPA79738.1 ferritin family protein [Thermoanaerobaculales bacterium]HQL31357.1 ferritin family protein [Thermoanaerobaculales bacterium]HQN96078.1 ferritin family protein [Thermoanaerobaculales bacterium]HQP42698.1 ferritin family protein [Thermoanaerobaculales bacterium]